MENANSLSTKFREDIIFAKPIVQKLYTEEKFSKKVSNLLFYLYNRIHNDYDISLIIV